MAIEQGADNIEEMTRALSGMFRYSISRKGKTKALMEEELANVNNYLRIQQYRFRNKINITETIDPAAKKCCVPKLLIQPIVENAVFYGFRVSRPLIPSSNGCSAPPAVRCFASLAALRGG